MELRRGEQCQRARTNRRKGEETACDADISGKGLHQLGALVRVATVDYPKWLHVGFMQDDDAKVDAIHRRLKADGHAVGERENTHGAWTLYFTAPGGFVVEVWHQKE